MEDFHPFRVEGIVHHFEGHFVDHRSVEEEVDYRFVGLHIDFVLLVDSLLPPVAAHEQEREYQAEGKYECQKVAGAVALMGFIAHYQKRCLIDGHRLIVVEGTLLLVEGGEIVDICHCWLLIACEEVGALVDAGRQRVGKDHVVGGPVASSREASSETSAVVVVIVPAKAMMVAEAEVVSEWSSAEVAMAVVVAVSSEKTSPKTGTSVMVMVVVMNSSASAAVASSSASSCHQWFFKNMDLLNKNC